MKEIASAVGTPIDIDGSTRNHTFGYYARILVEIDLSKKAYDEVLVERDGFRSWWKYNTTGDLCFAIIVTPLDIISLLVDG